MNDQMSFTAYLKAKNMYYAKKCRRAIGEYCYAKKKEIDASFLCPCDDFEEKLHCEGCRHERGGLTYCLQDPICKRYTFSPAVSTKRDPDKWEAKQ